MKNKIFKAIEYIKDAIKDTAWEGKIYAVGGCVRDMMMGLEPKDLDLVVAQSHGGVSFSYWITNKANCNVIGKNPLVFANYGTAKFKITSCEEIADVEIESVQTRKEAYNPNSRNPYVMYGTIEEDAMRRDLTINSLYLNISTGEVLDVNGNGEKDLHEHIIRATNNPDSIFSEDPLRMLRCIRFATRFGWGIEKETWMGIVRNAHRIGIISQERITDEINKILLCDKPSKGIEALYNSGLIGYVLPEIKDLVNVKQGEHHIKDVFGHTMDVLDNTPKHLETRIAALFHDVGKPKVITNNYNATHFYDHDNVGANITKEVLKRMKYSNETMTAVVSMVKNHMKFKQFKDTTVPSNKFLRKFHAAMGDNLYHCLDLIHADNISHKERFCLPNQINSIRAKYKELEKKGEDAAKIILPINGNDIMEALKLKKSPLIGKYLSIVKDAYLENPKITKEEALNLIKVSTISE